jgi:hypothetical protein
MSKQNNVNPGYYKLAGRERQGEGIVQDLQKQTFAEQQAETERWQEKQSPPQWQATPPAAAVEAEPKPKQRRRSRPSKKTGRRPAVGRKAQSVSRTRRPGKARSRTKPRRAVKPRARSRKRA